MSSSQDRFALPDDYELDFVEARYPLQLGLPAGRETLFQDAGQAVMAEFRDSVKWKRMRCRSVKKVSESKEGMIYLLEVGHAVEFDWTWEGSTAFRPLNTSNFSDDSSEPFSDADADIDDSMVWSGEILEVDETSGRIFMTVTDPENPPTTGTFYVRPFEFLAVLNAVFNHPNFQTIQTLLPSRLNACEGNIHPEVMKPTKAGLPQLHDWWSRSWCHLWGPPGTGKTYTTGQQVAKVLRDPTERILVVSTTNRATDAAAISIGRAAKKHASKLLDAGSLLRIGKGASLEQFEASNLKSMLKGTETEFLSRIDELTADLARTEAFERKAKIRLQIKSLQNDMRDAAQINFLNKNVRVVVSTAFKASLFLRRDEVKDPLGEGFAPFTTVFIDEAGLISRAASSALSLLASRRVVLVGDSKQLAPISRISRILPTNQMTWLAKSGLTHLTSLSNSQVGVHVLKEQHRMHPDVCSLVSNYQYDGHLVTADKVRQRQYAMPKILQDQPRAIWYVLDEDGGDRPSIRAERGPSNRSWIRLATKDVLDRMFLDPTMAKAKGLFISPFKAQAKEIASFFVKRDLQNWSASTVHSQQGAEADIVLFDTVNAGSHSWPYDEWKRLVNVAMSRSREMVLILASRSEMSEPYLRPLISCLAARVLRKKAGKLVWEKVTANKYFALPDHLLEVRETNSIGYQLSTRKQLQPVLSHDQEKLCRLELDGKPRLVRGVAGSGKTVVLANWVMQTLQRLSDQPDLRIWAVFANRSLQSLIADSIEDAWGQEVKNQSFPWEKVKLCHIRDVLEPMLRRLGKSMDEYSFDYDKASKEVLDRIGMDGVGSCCEALFIDEAQDLGPFALQLLTKLVTQSDPADPNSRSVNIFYDNAQNIYDRATPKWSEIGLDMRGRSTVMKESFRSTKPITEFALNALYRLSSMEDGADHKELHARGLIEKGERLGGDWWSVRFNQIDGPKPQLFEFVSIQKEFEAIAQYVSNLIRNENVLPTDICLLYVGENVKSLVDKTLRPALAPLGVEVLIQANQGFHRASNTLLVTTPNSFKGYDSEIVIIPAADQFVAREKGILAHSLYVAMTRARSILTLFTSSTKSNRDGFRIQSVLRQCLDALGETPLVETQACNRDDLDEILNLLGHEHGRWLHELWRDFPIKQEPMVAPSGEVVAEPLFWFANKEAKLFACFGNQKLSQRISQRLEDFGVQVLKVGDAIDS